MTALLQRWRNRIGRRHPSTDRLLEMAFGATSAATALSTARHLRRCAPCRHRAGELRTLLDTLADASGASFDEAFPPERLQVQRARIDHRLARAGGRAAPARVLAFPFRRTPVHRADLRPRRWAPAAAVGLALGMVAGQLVHLYRSPAPAPGAAFTESRAEGNVEAPLLLAGTIELPPAPAGETATTLTLSEFEQVMTETALLDTLDVATISLPVTELASIDALTPHVSESDLAATGR